MKLYNYIERKLHDTESSVKFASLVARRALAGGDADQLLEICQFFGTRFRSYVMEEMNGSGCHLLEVLLWLKEYYIYDVTLSKLRHNISIWEDADDWDEIYERLNDKYGIVRCDDCGQWELGDNARCTWDDDSANICRHCIDNSYTYSSRYDAFIYCDHAQDALDENGRRCTIHEDDDEFHYDEDEGTYVHQEYEPAINLIGNYHSSKGSHRLQKSEWTKMKQRYLGVELEVEVRPEIVTRVDKAKELHFKINGDEFGRNVFFENDGSLNHGFEIITQPMGLDKHRELWEFLKSRDAVKGLRSHQTTTCGLHVHVSREKMSKLQIAKIVAFVNAPENEQLIRAVARRYAEGYCKIKNKKIGQSAHSDDRYEAVNITPRRTIEFRIFRGSLKYESVMAAIEFSNALVDFCAEGRTSIQDLNADKFIDFIKTEIAEDTTYLRPYLEQRLETA